MPIATLVYTIVALTGGVSIHASVPDTLVWSQVAVLYDASAVELGNFKGRGGFTLEGVFYDVVSDGRTRAKIQLRGHTVPSGPIVSFTALGPIEIDLTPEVSNAPTHGITTGPWVMYSAFYGNLRVEYDGLVGTAGPTWGGVKALWR